MPVTLLLADDSVVIQKLVGLSFANEDIEVVTVDNGDDAISQALECRPDIILADVVMPGMSGYEVCAAIRKQPELAGTPVLLLTGTFEAFDEGRANEVGAIGHITKPFEAQVLVDRVNKLLEQCRSAAADSPASPSPVADDDFFDDNLGNLAGPSSEDLDPAAVSSNQVFAFGTSPDPAPQSPSTSSSGTSPLSSPLVDFGDVGDVGDVGDLGDRGRETISMVSASELDSLLDGVGGDRTVAIMPERSTEDATSKAEFASGDPGETILVDDFLDRPSANSESISTTSVASTESDSAVVSTLESSLPEIPNDDLLDLEVPAGDETVWSGDLFAAGPELDSSLDPVFSDAVQSRSSVSQGLDIDFASAPSAESIVPENANDYDVSSSDLNLDLLGSDPSWSAGIPAGVQTAPEPISIKPDNRESTAAPLSAKYVSPPELSKELGSRIHDTLEKIAWEAFSDLSEEIVSQLMKRVEQIAWEVIPQMAETLIRDEIRQMKAEEGAQDKE